MSALVVRQEIITIASGPTKAVSGDSFRIALHIYSYSAAMVFFGPLSSMVIGGGMFAIPSNSYVDIFYRQFGAVVGYDMYVSGNVGDKVVITEIV